MLNNNGFEFVDLGLPSKTLWSTKNVGADKPSDFGLYFQWGDVQGYTQDQIGYGKKKFSSDWSDYKWGVRPNFSKYNTDGATLELEDDAAYIHMGGDWHIPTPTQIQELIDNTTSEWTTLDGVRGKLFKSKKNPSKSIFIPADGYASDGSLYGSGSEADVWSSVLHASNVNLGQYLGFTSSNVSLVNGGRFYGFSVRGVIG